MRFHIPISSKSFFFGLFAAFSMISCGTDKDQGKPGEPPLVMYKKEKDSAIADKAPVINMVDSVAPRLLVLYKKDSASSSLRIGLKLFEIYNKQLPAIIKENKLEQKGPRMAWYKSSKAPFFFEAGFPVNKKPARLPRGVFMKNTGGDSAYIAHYYGPYELTYHAYEAIRERMKEEGKKPSTSPYEIYVDEAYDSLGKPRDPFKIRTDIIFPHR